MASRPDWLLTHNTKAFHIGDRKANWTEGHYSRGVLPNRLTYSIYTRFQRSNAEQSKEWRSF